MINKLGADFDVATSRSGDTPSLESLFGLEDDSALMSERMGTFQSARCGGENNVVVATVNDNNNVNIATVNVQNQCGQKNNAEIATVLQRGCGDKNNAIIATVDDNNNAVIATGLEAQENLCLEKNNSVIETVLPDQEGRCGQNNNAIISTVNDNEDCNRNNNVVVATPPDPPLASESTQFDLFDNASLLATFRQLFPDVNFNPGAAEFFRLQNNR